MYINGRKSSAHECGGHLILTVDTLLTQHRNARFCGAVIGPGNIVAVIESQYGVESRIIVIEDAIEFFPCGRRIVTQRLNLETRFRPVALQSGAIQLQHDIVIAAHSQRLTVVLHATNRSGFCADAIQHHLHLREFFLCDLHDSAGFFAE